MAGLTAGVEVQAASALGWVGRELGVVLGGAPTGVGAFGRMRLEVEATDFSSDSGSGSHSGSTSGSGSRIGGIALMNAATSGFDLSFDVNASETQVVARWRPGRREQALSRVLRARQRLLLAQALVHYPVLWQAGTGGAVPIAGCVLMVQGRGVLISGPSGVGKSTLVAQELAAGATAVSDNLVVLNALNRIAHGVVEPLRADFSLLPPGVATPLPRRRTTHGRGEGHLNRRADSVSVDAVVLLRRNGAAPGLTRLSPGAAARSLAAATYTAGELRRYWPFAAALAAAAGLGPVHPAVSDTCRALCAAVPCAELEVGPAPGPHLSEALNDLESAPAWT
ncbi:MAG: hypothetical protein HOV87_04070 [Catenulispora sp.]|nr:hypothetical protein [Catenulispora sp.]